MKQISIIIILLSLFSCLKKEEINNTTSTTSFGHDQENTASYKYNYPKIKSFLKDDHSIFQDVIHTMPLYLDLNKKKHLILSTKYNQLISYDISSKKVIFKTSLPGNRITSTPVYNPNNRSIYIKTAGGKSSQQIINSVDLNGKLKSSFKLDLNKHFSNKIDVSSKLQCKTALSLIEEKQKIVFGCSIKSQVYNRKKDIVLYGTHQGVTGVVFSYDINTNKINSFKTSKKTNSEYSGMDTGIYLSGGSFPVYKDEILVSTGNGPYDGSDNFGCSILKIKVLEDKLELIGHLNLNKVNTTECHSLNLDMTSSSPVRLTDNTVYVASKEGVLHAFDYETMGKNFYQKKKIGELPHYSQGAVLKNGNESYFVSHWSNYFNHERYSFATVLERSTKLLEIKNFKKKICLGSIDSKEVVNFELLFSGDYRNSYLEVPKKLAAKLTSPTHPNFLPKDIPKFYPVKNIWPHYTRLEEPSSLAVRKYKGSTLLSFYDFEERSIFLINTKKKVSKYLKAVPYSSTKEEFPKVSSCSSKNNRENIYLMEKVENYPKGRGLIVSSKVNGRVSTINKITGKDSNPHKTSPVIFKQNNKNYILSTAHRDERTNVSIYDAKSMKKVFNFYFEGESYFSIPLLTPTHFFFPTRSHGMKSFKILFEKN